jgi:hypothetical protein
VFALAGLGAASCTLGNLTDYEIEACKPAPSGSSAEEDPCSRLTGDGVDDCHEYACDDATRRCVLRERDEDRDGQPPQSCGGQDCDDENPTIGRGFTELCSDTGPFVDEDCNGVIDDTLAFLPVKNPSVVRNATDVRLEVSANGLVATFVQKLSTGQCIQAWSDGAVAGSGCTFPATARDPGFLPRQPSIASLGGTVLGVAYVETASACVPGALGYRMFDGTGAATFSRLPCGFGAALPAIVPANDGRSATVTYLATPLAGRDDPFDDCESSIPAPIRLATVEHASEPGAFLREPWAGALTDSSLAVRPPAMLRIDTSLFVSAPSGHGASLWQVDESAQVGDGGVALPGFDDARSVAMAMASDGTHIALVGQLGCGQKPVQFAIVERDATQKRLEVQTSTSLEASRGGLAADPGVTWISRRGEWLVTWVEAGPRVRAQRLSSDGTPIGEPLSVRTGAESVAVAADASVLGFEPGAGDEKFVAGALTCAAGG